MSAALPPEQWLEVVARAPLCSIDLILRDPRGRVLLGLRNNEPARGCWFVPGGCIRKNERIAEAFARIAADELGLQARLEDARLLGVYEHFYDRNFAGVAGITTHYVVQAYEMRLMSAAVQADAQHSELRWFEVDALLDSAAVHENTKVYFRR